MLREHAPLIAVATVSAIMFYLLFRDLRNLNAGVDAVSAQVQMMMMPPDTRAPMSGCPAALPAAAPPATADPEDGPATAEAPPVKRA